MFIQQSSSVAGVEIFSLAKLMLEGASWETKKGGKKRSYNQ